MCLTGFSPIRRVLPEVMSLDTTETYREESAKISFSATVQLVYERPKGIVDVVSYPVSDGWTNIGRALKEKTDISLPNDKRVSRLHAKIQYCKRTWMARISDENSRNGTFVNGQSVNEAALFDGDVIRIGDSFFVFRFQPHNVEDFDVPTIVGVCPGIRKARSNIGLIGPTEATVLLMGETGTGKELVARALHSVSGRNGPFVAVNCSAIPESLAESQLFGHLAGAFTGAQTEQPGFFRSAHGGTLFLDELGELSAAIQPKLLRALDEHAVVPVGTSEPISCDVRVISATDSDLPRQVSVKDFRGSLYARLSEISINIPPLRDRREDILLLIQHRLGPSATKMTPKLAEALLLYSWPYNVREILEVATELKIRGAGKDTLDLSLVGHRLEEKQEGQVSFNPLAVRPVLPSQPQDVAVNGPDETEPILLTPSRETLEDLLREYKGNISAISRESGRSRRQVKRWIEQYELNIDDYRQ